MTNSTYPGKWLVVFAWPLDFTFVCPTEIAEFGRKDRDFKDRDAQILGLSHDSAFVHLAWRNRREAELFACAHPIECGRISQCATLPSSS